MCRRIIPGERASPLNDDNNMKGNGWLVVVVLLLLQSLDRNERFKIHLFCKTGFILPNPYCTSFSRRVYDYETSTQSHTQIHYYQLGRSVSCVRSGMPGWCSSAQIRRCGEIRIKLSHL